MHLGIPKPKNTIRDGGSTALNAAYYVLFRVSQKKQKSEFWYATNPSGFHRLDEPPEKITVAPKYAYLGAYLGTSNMVKWGVPEKILQNAVQTRWF